jgi:hypothetical protein
VIFSSSFVGVNAGCLTDAIERTPIHQQLQYIRAGIVAAHIESSLAPKHRF